VSTAFLLAVAAAVLVHLFFHHTRLGFDLRTLGASLGAARASGLRINRLTALALGISAGFAALVGTASVLGYKGYFEEGIDTGAGFMGIAVALLAQKHPLGIIPAALLFGTLSQGGLAINAVVPKEIVDVLQAVVILAVTTTSEEFNRILSASKPASA
jgi:simple sugar transport system permease protein